MELSAQVKKEEANNKKPSKKETTRKEVNSKSVKNTKENLPKKNSISQSREQAGNSSSKGKTTKKVEDIATKKKSSTQSEKKQVPNATVVKKETKGKPLPNKGSTKTVSNAKSISSKQSTITPVLSNNKTIAHSSIQKQAKEIDTLIPQSISLKKNAAPRLKLDTFQPAKNIAAKTISQKINQDSIKKAKLLEANHRNDSIKSAKALLVKLKADSIAKAKQEAFLNDSLRLKSEVLDRYTLQEYKEVTKLGTQYLLRHPSDTDIIIKTGIAFIIEKKHNIGFKMIDSVLKQKDSIQKFYATLPYVNMATNDAYIYKALIKHIDELGKSSIYSYFSRASYYLLLDSAEQALKYAGYTQQMISSKGEAAELGFVFPTILYQIGKVDSAITILKFMHQKYPHIHSLEYKLYQYLRKSKRYEEALVMIKAISNKNSFVAEYFEDYIDLLLLTNNKSELCKVLKENNESFQYDPYAYQAKCESEFSTCQLKYENTYRWSYNFNGQIFPLQLKFDTLLSEAIGFRTDQGGSENWYFVENKFFDTLTNVLFTYNKKIIKKPPSVPLWISKKAYQDILITGQTYLNTEEGNILFSIVSDSDEVIKDANSFTERVVINGQLRLMDHYHLSSEDGQHQIWILKNPKNPLVLKYDNGNTLILKEVLEK